MEDIREKRNRRNSLLLSLLIHAALTASFFFILAWKAPYPPAAEYGIELNFGLDESGSGEIHPVAEEPDSEPAGEENTLEENEDQTSEEAEQEPAGDINKNELNSPVDENSPDITEKVESGSETTETTPKVTESNQTKAGSGKDKDPESGKTGATGSENQADSQGDNTGTTGDKGDPQGTVDARALYGTQGGGQGGSSLDMAGWIWDFEPRPDDTSSENGKIIFEIKINDRGEITSVRTLEKTVTPGVEKIYREAVEELTFSPLSANARPAASSTGKITFIIRSR